MWTSSLVCAVSLCWLFRCSLQGKDNVAEQGRAELQRVQSFASQPLYGECWARALEKIHTSCKEFTEETQSRIALAFTHCHLRRSGRLFPKCTDNSDVLECTQEMDPVAFNAYTEFFTHAHSICHYLESEHWQQRTEGTIQRLTESSAGVAEQLASTHRMAEDLAEAQSAALKSQETILRNGEELKLTLLDSTQGVKELFSEIQDSAREQHLVFSEIFNRVAFLQEFIMSESHTVGSLLYNSLGLCAAFLLTSTKRTSGARLVLFGLVAVNVYLERMICKTVLDSSEPGYQQLERIDMLVRLIRRSMVLLGLLILAYVAVRFRDVSLESMKVLTQLKETQSNLQRTLQQAEFLARSVEGLRVVKREAECLRTERWGRRSEVRAEDVMMVHELSAVLPVTPTHHAPSQSEELTLCDPQDSWVPESLAMEITKRRGRLRSSGPQHRLTSALVCSVLVDDHQPRYNLRNRRTLPGHAADREML